ncbi:hypothetical protein RFI_27697 [Reticulomyxa filosa]|uniref:Uncharacterized protein n=1 Tax=Reticulomyxa filosa TaxID=46433 RepID=X6M7P6_RETFI|nr:hypothetical protein RFI_27697 [Reticulomyxa filosa]|eukprot:ETO09676.1 hypothetical protein RFI_27697 [Reticulomyxa filosa]
MSHSKKKKMKDTILENEVTILSRQAVDGHVFIIRNAMNNEMIGMYRCSYLHPLVMVYVTKDGHLRVMDYVLEDDNEDETSQKQLNGSVWTTSKVILEQLQQLQWGRRPPVAEQHSKPSWLWTLVQAVMITQAPSNAEQHIVQLYQSLLWTVSGHRYLLAKALHNIGVWLYYSSGDHDDDDDDDDDDDTHPTADVHDEYDIIYHRSLQYLRLSYVLGYPSACFELGFLRNDDTYFMDGVIIGDAASSLVLGWRTAMHVSEYSHLLAIADSSPANMSIDLLCDEAMRYYDIAASDVIDMFAPFEKMVQTVDLSRKYSSDGTPLNTFATGEESWQYDPELGISEDETLHIDNEELLFIQQQANTGQMWAQNYLGQIICMDCVDNHKTLSAHMNCSDKPSIRVMSTLLNIWHI